MNQLEDIKPFIEISDNSLYLFIATLIIALFIAFFAFKIAKEYALSRCEIDCERYFFEKFKAIDWENPKRAAYEATFYGRLLAKDKRRKEIFLQLKERLDALKYKKNSSKLNAEIMKYYNLYKQVCDESL